MFRHYTWVSLPCSIKILPLDIEVRVVPVGNWTWREYKAKRIIVIRCIIAFKFEPDPTWKAHDATQQEIFVYLKSQGQCGCEWEGQIVYFFKDFSLQQNM